MDKGSALLLSLSFVAILLGGIVLGMYMSSEQNRTSQLSFADNSSSNGTVYNNDSPNDTGSTHRNPTVKKNTTNKTNHTTGGNNSSTQT
ncbi:MAG: hypothetical protein FJ150_04660 [Euryarchaeota archaeon]|nr:hypothetical protein [Euryarchaeota archaeon]